VHCVDGASTNPVPPYTTWATAAATIQDAIDSAAAGEFVLVTNGIYSTGGRVMQGDLTNRAAIIRPMTVTSVSGAAESVIQGAWSPGSTNGPLAVRCAWLSDGAIMNGFTLTGGGTRTNSITSLQSGGGAAGNNLSNCFLLNCLLTGNAAHFQGGGCY